MRQVVSAKPTAYGATSFLVLLVLVALAVAARLAPTIEQAYFFGAAASIIYIGLNYSIGYLWSLRLIPPLAFFYVFVPDAFNYPESYISRHFPFEYLVGAARQINLGYVELLIGVLTFDLFRTPLYRGIGETAAKQQVAAVSAKISAFWPALIFAFAYLPVMLPFAFSSLLSGRLEASNNLTFLFSIATGLMLFNVGVLAFSLRHERSTVRKVVSFVLLLLTIAIVVLSGTRFFLLFSASCLFAVFWDFSPEAERAQFRRALVLVVPAIAGLALLANYMVDVRGAGAFSDTNELGGAILPKGEDILGYFALLILHFEQNDFMYGMSHLSLLWFWIPRSIWPSKPGYLEHTVVHSFDFSSTFSEGHSGAFGLFGAAYADFGAVGVMVLAPIYGLGLAHLDRQFRKWMITRNYTRLIAAFLPGVTFFAMRQLSTAVFFFLATIALALVLKFLNDMFAGSRSDTERTVAPLSR